jgi:hypothetical protein
LSRLKGFISREQVHGYGGQHQSDNQPGSPILVQLGASATGVVFAVMVLVMMVLRHANYSRVLDGNVAMSK